MTNLETYLPTFTRGRLARSHRRTCFPRSTRWTAMPFRSGFVFTRSTSIVSSTRPRIAKQLCMDWRCRGSFDLKEQIDTSHHFLYGHRYWKTVKAAIEAEAVVFTDQEPKLIEEIKQIGMFVAEKLKVERHLVNGHRRRWHCDAESGRPRRI